MTALLWSRWCRKSDCSSPWLRPSLTGYKPPGAPEPEPVTPTRGDELREESENSGDLYLSLIECVLDVCSITANNIQWSSCDCCKLGLQIMQRARHNIELKNFVVQGDGTSKSQNKHLLAFCDPSLLF